MPSTVSQFSGGGCPHSSRTTCDIPGFPYFVVPAFLSREFFVLALPASRLPWLTALAPPAAAARTVVDPTGPDTGRQAGPDVRSSSLTIHCRSLCLGDLQPRCFWTDLWLLLIGTTRLGARSTSLAVAVASVLAGFGRFFPELFPSRSSPT